MPGGRNSGAVYNMYKVKYKKNKKAVKPPTSMGMVAYNQYNSLMSPKPRMEMTSVVEKMDTTSAMYALSSSSSSDPGVPEATSLSAPASPYHDRPSHPPAGINILKAVLTGSQDVSFTFLFLFNL